MTDGHVHPTADDLCRAARALRARLAGSPRKLHAALEQLVVRPPTARIVPSPVPPPAEQARMRFARDVLERLDGPILRYSMRLELYKLARRKGLSIFEANLVIAQVQHAAGAGRADDVADGRPTPDSPGGGRLVLLLAAAATQAAILGAGWAIFA